MCFGHPVIMISAQHFRFFFWRPNLYHLLVSFILNFCGKWVWIFTCIIFYIRIWFNCLGNPKILQWCQKLKTWILIFYFQRKNIKEVMMTINVFLLWPMKYPPPAFDFLKYFYNGNDPLFYLSNGPELRSLFILWSMIISSISGYSLCFLSTFPNKWNFCMAF